MRSRLGISVVLVCALGVVPAALAHAGDPRLEISPERLQPGAVLSVRGVQFSYEDDVALVLAGHGRKVRLGRVTADDEGVFSTAVVLPAYLAEGGYTLRAVTEHHDPLSLPISIVGTPVTGGDEGARREEEDSLLAPMPSAQPATASAAAAPAGEIVDEIGFPAPVPAVAAAAAALCALAGAGIAYRRRGRRA